MIKRFTLTIVLLFATMQTWAQDFVDFCWQYEIISNANLTVRIVGRTCNWQYDEITIPSSVTHNGITFTVTEIGDYACFERYSDGSHYLYLNRLYHATTINIPNTIVTMIYSTTTFYK